MFNLLKNRVLTALGPDPPSTQLPAIKSSSSFSNTNHSSSGSGSSSTSSSSSYRNSKHGSSSSSSKFPDKFDYGRPGFLQLSTPDELKASADHKVRPIIVPRDITLMPFCAGYAECINSGKSKWNEDQGAFHRQILSHPTNGHPDLPYVYFGIFDGHAGYGAALAASHQFHHILNEKLVDVIDQLMPNPQPEETLSLLDSSAMIPTPRIFYKTISRDELIIGALESAFHDMDDVLRDDRERYGNAGGCTACVTLFIFGKMFIANAGDSRAVLCHRMSTEALKSHALNGFSSNVNLGVQEILSTSSSLNTVNVIHQQNGNGVGGDDDCSDDNIDGDENNKENHLQSKQSHQQELQIYPIPVSHDHTPETERARLMSTAMLNPSLMGDLYVAMEYAKRPVIKDLGTRIMYRQGTMKGWAYKTLTADDLRMPLVSGEGKRSRLMGTIGVTRGFGDHNLRAYGRGMHIKPYLSPHPDVIYRDLSKIFSVPSQSNEDGDYGILVMGTDGLWDVADCESVSKTVFQTLARYTTEKYRYTVVAHELVNKSRGRVNDSGHWRLDDTKTAATVDDISVFVIPVYQYFLEYTKLVEQLKLDTIEATEAAPTTVIENDDVVEPTTTELIKSLSSNNIPATVAVSNQDLQSTDVSNDIEQIITTTTTTTTEIISPVSPPVTSSNISTN